ncbi:MAG TPA: hypothetical protein VL981_05840 [Candidatus Methylacidiphilales bacterium]|nr:hypothetical protein [Candidatus Methylacidiphilales bacterium]
MPWSRPNDSDPLEIKRRKLQEQERLLAEQMSRLTEELHKSGEPLPEEIRPSEPPVWRLEEDGAHSRVAEPAPRRNLARQRQRDKILFFVLVAILLIVLGLFIWSISAHHAE